MAKDEASTEPMDDAMESEDAAMSTEGAWIDQAAYDADPASTTTPATSSCSSTPPGAPPARRPSRASTPTECPRASPSSVWTTTRPTTLKKEYGVTVQHTYVQVDESGDELAKFTGSISGEDIAAQTV